MPDLDALALRQVGDRAGHLQYAMRGPRAPREPRGGMVEEGRGGALQPGSSPGTIPAGGGMSITFTEAAAPELTLVATQGGRTQVASIRLAGVLRSDVVVVIQPDGSVQVFPLLPPVSPLDD